MWKMDNEVKIINKRIEEVLPIEEPKELSDAMRHLILSGGKRLRPIITMHAAGAIDAKMAEKGLEAGVALELIHNFTLIHDDIMDKSLMRRHVKTTHVIFGEDMAINAGDAMFAKAFSMFYDLPHTRRLVGEVSLMVHDLCKGQAMDILGGRTRDGKDLKWYLKMIEYKTAKLLQSSARCGAIVAGATDRETDLLGAFAWDLGMAFQIQDDLLDAIGDDAKTGKAVGGDIKEGKNTILVVHALENASAKEKKIIQGGLGRGDKIKEVIEAFKRAGSMDFAKRLADEYAGNARKSLQKLKNSKDKEILMQILDYTLKREK
ncbi:MAG: polyprenyl synthetase family protein [Candidatus Thermoplasmatota archaeon]|nr:polyprenyl synthetase family protein [Candidatus Thermoplasmatota archaeon]